ncbi:uncharacterized protein Dwil_GK13653 [Drosophila willistoni]|uniref:DNA repair protein RAD51 homolog 3 n=1 Tax=Drosophila willistoni TaxID=7260 RepID=B4NHG9_DROWI|nr:DNA repair protein RAD51 homolog 3 isoform X2 [Drosophila willistoni]EDW83538.2 uncharacterized protein Dwil_GK13653 [Drosophila willistoni]
MLSLQNICKKSSFDLHNKRCFRISTGNKSLDVHLKGGIPLGKLIELIGNPGTGKTQMCMKLCLNVQLPRTLGGLDGESLFFDTRRDFNPNRLKELADEFERRYSTAGKSKAMNAEQMLRNVHYVQCTSPAHLIAQVRMTNKYLAANPNIKIIIIDSLSFALRMIQTVRQRYELLLELYVSMRSMLYQHQDQWIVTNVFTNYYNRRSKKYCRVPGMGRMHSILVNERIWFSQNGTYYLGKNEKTRRIIE